MLIDTSNRDLYIFTRNEDSNNNEGIYYKSTSLDNIQFSPSSIGTPFIRSDTNMDVNINDPTSTKQNVNSTTGLVVLASDSSERRYYHNYRSLSGIQYSLTVNTTGTGSGSVTLDPPGGFYDEGANVTLTATAAPGSVFSGWSGDLTGSTNPGNIVMNGNKSVTATFTQVPQYTLDVNISGSGTVALDPPGGVYNQGTTVTLTATPQAGWEFTGWGGALAGTTNPTTIVMDANKTVSANFQPVQTYLLTVNTVGSGNVELTPPGPIYNEGAVVSLLAQPAPGWRFTGWSGDLSGTTNPQSLTMDSDKTVTATFVAEYTLTVNAVGSGNVTVDPPNGPYLAGTQVTLTANPAPSWVFSGWSGDATGSTNPVTITMDGDKEVTATFALPDYTLTVNTVGSGSVALSPPGGQYEDGTLVTLTATPDPGWAFSGWSGDILSGMNNPATIRMDNNYTVVATFSPTSPVTHTLTVDIVGSGDVTLDPPGGSYGPGTMVTLTADANSGWRFSGWSGALSGTTNPASLTMDANKAVIATFVQNEPGIDLDVSTSALTMTEGGTITYTYRVTNIGEAVLNNVALVDDHHGAIPLAIATLASGEAVTAQLVYSIRHVDLPGPLTTTATVMAASPLGEEVSDSETVAINLIPLPFAYYMPFGLSFAAPAPPGVNANPDAFVFMSSNRVQSAGAAQMPGAAAQLAHRRR
jgi:uncharacterized repeat protein (TIGR02543 family)